MAEEIIPISSEESEEENVNSEENEEDDEDDENSGRSKILLDLNDIIYDIDAPGTFACGGPIKLILPGK